MLFFPYFCSYLTTQFPYLMNMKKIPLAVYTSVCLLLAGCGSAPTTSTRTISTPTARTSSETSQLADGCPLDKINWLVVSTQYNNSELALLAQKFSEAAQADAQELNKMALNGDNSPLRLSSALKSVIDNAASTKIQVSDDFYKQYATNRLAMCGIIEALQRGSIKKDESAKATESAFRNVANSFNSLSGNLRVKADNEKK